MRYRTGKVPPSTLAALAILAILAYVSVETFKVDAREKFYEEKKAAVSRVRQGQDAIRAARLHAGLKIEDDHDPARTGLIGLDDAGPLTTDRGYLRSKQIATHPNFAAAVVALLKEAKVRKGDVVAVGMTGSFPGANLATIAAIEAIGAKPVVQTSIGASTFGANQAEFTWLDMEKAAFDAGAIHVRSVAASIGGDKDKGVGLNKSSIELARAAMARNGIPKIEEKTLVDSIARHMEIFEREAGGLDRIKCYVNIGGGLASVGSNQVADKLIDTGLTERFTQRNYPVEGVMIRMLKAGKPVIHLKDLRKFAADHDLPLAQAKPGEAGEGPLFFSQKYNLVLVLVALVVLVAIIVAVSLLDLRHVLFGRPPRSPAEPKVEVAAAPDAGETPL